MSETQIEERVSERLAHKEQEILAIRQAHEQRVGELEADLAEQKASFDLRWKADMRAIKRWQEATGRKDTWPDHADLCVWLLEQSDKQSALLAQMAEALDMAFRHLKILYPTGLEPGLAGDAMMQEIARVLAAVGEKKPNATKEQG